MCHGRKHRKGYVPFGLPLVRDHRHVVGPQHAFYHDRWEPGVVRLVTSFATTADGVDGLVDAVRRLAV
ncbi:hypothetical protein [Streptomyces sp. Ag109_O5-1]|uniref:hypothetical protein n=1 Tax=Streptomyces sp. Ag109_O5-1 TaxID=1938851 RepID=UPI0016267641|nr:hypothetical protein [Streptomyces sp. Ag109_O5-1]